MQKLFKTKFTIILLTLLLSSTLGFAENSTNKNEENIPQRILSKFKFLTGKSDNDIDLDRFTDAKEEGENYRITLDKVNKDRFFNTAILRGLNKITAITSPLKVQVGKSINFGKLTINVHKCWQAPTTEKPDSKILLEVFENKNDGQKVRIFYGWMIASSPSVSGLEHPIYDITALNCKNE